MKKLLFYFFYIIFSIDLFASEYLPKIFIGETEVCLGMTKKEIVYNFGEPDSITIDLVSVNDEYSSVKMDYSKELFFYYNKGDEEIHTIITKRDFFLFLDTGNVVSTETSIKDLRQIFSDIQQISENIYVINFQDNKRTIITDDIYFYFGLEGKIEQIIVTNDYY